MDYDVLVEQIVAEVLRRLGEAPQTPPPFSQKVSALAVFTGGLLGLEESLAQVKTLQTRGFSFTVLLSAAAETVIGLERIQAQLGRDVKIMTGRSPYPGKELREAELVLIPVLTQNTAAKIAATQADSLCSTVIMQALMMGKPVVAASNAADPQDGSRKEKNMGKAAPALLEKLRENLETISLYGVQLVAASELAAACEGSCGKAAQQKTNVAKPAVKEREKRTVLDAKAVQEALAQGVQILSLSPQTIITPLARDMARDAHITFQFEEA